MKKIEKIQLEAAADWQNEKEGYTLCHASLGFDGEIYILLASADPELFDGSFPQTRTNESVNYKALVFKEGKYRTIPINNQKWNYHFLQPLGEKHLLLACARSTNYGNGKVDENARIFDREGNFIRSFCIGDGIEHLYTSRDEKIWAGYFDEGIFGNFGWDNNPIGKSGLICWDSNGKIIGEHEQPANHFIMDCYALNIPANNEAWFYFYSDFQLGVRKNGKTEYFIPDIKGGTAFAVYDDLLLFNGGYGVHDRFYLFKRNGFRYRKIKEIVFTDPAGRKLKLSSLSVRGSLILLQCDSSSFVFDLKCLGTG